MSVMQVAARRNPLFCFRLLLLMVSVGWNALGAEEAALAAARVALDAGQPVEAGQCLTSAPDSDEKRVLQARVQVALGHAQDGLATLGIDRLEQPDAEVAQWPLSCRGEVAACVAEAALSLGRPRPALPLLKQALALGGAHLEVDRCLALYLDGLLQQGFEAEALQVAENLWHGWPRSRYRAHGGLVVAHDLLHEQPTAAREILSAIRVDASVSYALHLQAMEELCTILYEIHPGQCLVVAEQEMAFAQEHHHDAGDLPRLRALAWCQLDPAAGARALRELPASLAMDPTVVAALAAADHAHSVTIAMSCERAVSEAALGRSDSARHLLEPLAGHDDLALVTLLSLPGTDPRPWIGTPAARTPRAAMVLASSLIGLGEPQRAWSALQPVLSGIDHGLDAKQSLELRYWASRCDPDHQQRGLWREQMLSVAPPGRLLELGMAWCDQAQARVDAGLDSTSAWVAAAKSLPQEHPYFPEACWRAALALSAAGDDDQARAILSGDASWGGEDVAHERCRFLLVQLQARHGDTLEALRAARSLLGRGKPDQQQRLETLIHQLETKTP
jgi:hypothetical protein